MTDKMEDKVLYIGDGVYCSINLNIFNRCNSVTLWTDRDEGRHWMVLDPSMVKTLYEQVFKTNESDAKNA